MFIMLHVSTQNFETS